MSYDGHGLGISFAGGFTANIISAGGPTVERESIETSHLLTTGGFKTYIGRKLCEGGELSLQIEYDGAAAPPFVDADPELVSLSHDDAPIGITFDGFFSGFDAKFENGQRIVADVKVKVAGAVSGL